MKFIIKVYTECEVGQMLSVSVHWSHSGSTPQEPSTNTKTKNLYLMFCSDLNVQMTRYTKSQLWPRKSVSGVRLFHHFVDEKHYHGICTHWQNMTSDLQNKQLL